MEKDVQFDYLFRISFLNPLLPNKEEVYEKNIQALSLLGTENYLKLINICNDKDNTILLSPEIVRLHITIGMYYYYRNFLGKKEAEIKAMLGLESSKVRRVTINVRKLEKKIKNVTTKIVEERMKNE